MGLRDQWWGNSKGQDFEGAREEVREICRWVVEVDLRKDE